MGYNTDFEGQLKFTMPITSDILADLGRMLRNKDASEIDCEEYKKHSSDEWRYINLEFGQDFKSIQWDANEKTYGMQHAVNFIISVMRKKFPDFGLEGEMIAQGEDCEDRWKLVIVDGRAIKQPIEIIGKKAECPECGHVFLIEETTP